MFAPGDVISYLEMCQEEAASLQRGMNFRLGGDHSVVLMSLRRGAPYADRIEENGRVLIYEGHDISRTLRGRNPKKTDQPKNLPSGKLTQNGLFLEAALRTKRGEATAELVRVYEKIRNGVWVFDGIFALLDARLENSGSRKVFKFKLELVESSAEKTPSQGKELPHSRLIPTAVKLEVWKRDAGKCVQCGSRDNLHFDHDLPYSKGGSSLLARNILLLCARHNLQKHDKII
jgi:hypothetical protein